MYLNRFGFHYPSWDELCRKDPYYAWKDIDAIQSRECLTKEEWIDSGYINLMSPYDIDRMEEDKRHAELFINAEEYFPGEYEPVPDWKVASDKITELLGV